MQDEERNNLFPETKREQQTAGRIQYCLSRNESDFPYKSIYIYIYISAVTANDSRCCTFERNKK